MSNRLGEIYATTKNAEKYIVLDSQNVELSGNVKLTNGNLDVSQNLIFSNFSVTDKINFRENSGSTSYNIVNNSLTAINDASFNNLEISGTIKLPDSGNNGYGISGESIISQGPNNPPIWNPNYKVYASSTLTGPFTVFYNSAQPNAFIDTRNSLFVTDYESHPNIIVNGGFTAPRAGKYFFTASYKLFTSGTNLTTVLEIYESTSGRRMTSTSVPNVENSRNVIVQSIVDLDVNETVFVRIDLDAHTTIQYRSYGNLTNKATKIDVFSVD